MKDPAMPASTTTLAEVLERFNRKERNLLVRDILGHAEAKLRLSSDFVERIQAKTNVTLGADAWWATDYHFDWLFAAVMVFLGQTVPAQVHPNTSVMTLTQEDADLIIADGNHLMLVEAKAYGGFGNEQVARKRLRFDQLRALAGDDLDLHFLLMSPREPQRLAVPPGSLKLPWIPLKIDGASTICRVECCDAAGKPAAAGGYWSVVEAPVHKVADGGGDPP
jgi:hypothetical protein